MVHDFSLFIYKFKEWVTLYVKKNIWEVLLECQIWREGKKRSKVVMENVKYLCYFKDVFEILVKTEKREHHEFGIEKIIGSFLMTGHEKVFWDEHKSLQVFNETGIDQRSLMTVLW